MESVLEFDGVSFSYGNGAYQIKILDNVSASFESGLFYAIIGPSGSGKTTTLALAGALDVPQKGRIIYRGKDIREIGLSRYRRKHAALIFQNFNLINYMTALENVMLAMEISGSHRGKRRKDALQLLQTLGLSEDEAGRNVMKLSGGQQQRVAIARALASDAEVILADEPTGNLDAQTAREITGIFRELAHVYKKCVIVVSHSREVAAAADLAYRLENGSLSRVLELPGNRGRRIPTIM